MTIVKPLKHPIAGEELTIEQTAWLFNVAKITVVKWLALPENPIPSDNYGRDRRINIRKAQVWHDAHKDSTWQMTRGRPSERKSEYPKREESERKLAHLKVMKEEFNLSKLNKEFVSAELYYAVFANIVAQTRTDFLSLPNRLRGEFGEDVYLRTKSLVDIILNNLAAKTKNAQDIDSIKGLGEGK